MQLRNKWKKNDKESQKNRVLFNTKKITLYKITRASFSPDRRRERVPVSPAEIILCGTLPTEKVNKILYTLYYTER